MRREFHPFDVLIRRATQLVQRGISGCQHGLTELIGEHFELYYTIDQELYQNILNNNKTDQILLVV